MTWTALDRSQGMVWRPFYFANLIVDPNNENKIYKPDGPLIVSNDGGKTFSGISGGASTSCCCPLTVSVNLLTCPPACPE